jgi:hypothetical protein
MWMKWLKRGGEKSIYIKNTKINCEIYEDKMRNIVEINFKL